MSRVDRYLTDGLKALRPRPADDASQSDKKRYSEQVSAAIAIAIARELRDRGLADARPFPSGGSDRSGAERRMAGGIGAKKVDVTWATEESGLLLAISIKSINFRDRKTGNFQKNLTNRRGDMLIEAVTLHRRFPYAVLAGFFFFDQGAELDGTATRRSTLENAHPRLKLFTGRADPAGRDEQFERLYVALMEASPERVSLQAYEVGRPHETVPLERIIKDLIGLVAERNPDFYEIEGERLVSLNRRSTSRDQTSSDDVESGEDL